MIVEDLRSLLDKVDDDAEVFFRLTDDSCLSVASVDVSYSGGSTDEPSFVVMLEK